MRNWEEIGMLRDPCIEILNFKKSTRKTIIQFHIFKNEILNEILPVLSYTPHWIWEVSPPADIASPIKEI